jgi:ATP-binding cassette subfamily B protein
MRDVESLPTSQKLIFSNVTFTYPGMNKAALSNVSFSINPGETVSFVGKSGSGKSTIMKLLLRFYEEWNGEISLGGVDIRQLPPEVWMGQIAVVFQDGRLLQKNIFDNVRMSCKNATKEQVLSALHQAQCADIPQRSPRGLDTIIGEDGFYLSGGEQQCICIARAIFKDAPFVLLDEATAYLDDYNTELVENALRNLLAGKTVIRITHKLTKLRPDDFVMMVDKGFVIQSGIHKNLCITEGAYREIWKEQCQALEWKIEGGMGF